MITVKVGDIFESEAQTWVNAVNCVGVMGKGIALEFRKRFPEMHEDYLARCGRGEVRLGWPYAYRVRRAQSQIEEARRPELIVNFPTKGHWQEMSKLSAIEEGLAYFATRVREWGITSLAVPALGCGHGQLAWAIVEPIMCLQLAGMAIPVELYLPHGKLA